ncbi:MAG: 1-phosphofructokinase, partial [Verrucomicrobiae bacterium]|nr:1-phosphofructokinase [Verrucomicrobiae bacterium]
MTGSRRILTVTLNPALDWNVEVDRVVREEKNRVLDSRRVPGGKGVNVSRVLERFDIDSRCFAVLGGTAGREFA